MLLKKGLLSAPSGGGSSTIEAEEIPTGVKNGINRNFTISHTPVTNSLLVFINGAAQTKDIDYTLSGINITFLEYAPVAEDNLLTQYRYI